MWTVVGTDSMYMGIYMGDLKLALIPCIWAYIWAI